MPNRICVESSVISYLACVSTLVIDEISRGDEQAALSRVRWAQGLKRLDETEDAIELAQRLLSASLVPRTEPEDALHIALATVNACRYLVSWNFAHFVGLEPRFRLIEQLKAWGYAPAYLVTPEELLFGAAS
jgi:hypothetical protein